ncbi:MAG: IS200/IS605 family transposase [Verrucomicrobia bacterium]|jgi:REP element-mobilizing transposase RayT|nr:IS200/IS605 family transposase [Verrucomicrobiota bacterium]
MPQSLSHIAVHFVFSTKNRIPWLSAELRPKLHAYLANVSRNLGCSCYKVGGVEDHVHMAVRLSRTLSAAGLVEKAKTASSRWLKTNGNGWQAFSWQRGYAAISVDPNGINAVSHYIATQENHHREVSFQDEYRALLRESGIEFKEKYMWD